MASFTIGRLFEDHTVQISMSRFSGRVWQVGGLANVADADEGVALRRQMEWMSGNVDEPFVAVEWAEDPTVDGFYRLASLEVEPTLMHLVDGTVAWAATLVRVGNQEYPPFESHCTWNLLTNNRSVTSGTFTGVSVPQFAVPSTAWDVGQVSGTVSGTQASLNTIASADTTTLRVAYGVTVPASGIYGWSIDPGDYYVGACRVTTDIGAATDRLVFGQGYSDPGTDWIVSNGVVRFFIEPSNSTLTVETWTGTVWNRTNATDYRFQHGGTTTQHQTMTVMRNSPECVSVRLAQSISSTKVRVYVDLTLLRGSAVVYGYMSVQPTSSNWPTSATMGVQTTASVASTAMTGGFRATSADAAGYRFGLVTGAPACTDTVATGRTVTSAATTSLSFGITSGSSTTLVQNNGYEFFARRTEVTRVVDR